VDKFLARQPIFDAHRAVFGYELLFRSSLENFCSIAQPDVASTSTADNLFLFGIERLTQGRRAFLNCTRDFLVCDYPALLPRDRVVLELLENIKVDEETIAVCRRFKQMGYLIALDDFRDSPEWRPLVLLADFIKVDLRAKSHQEQSRLGREYAATGAGCWPRRWKPTTISGARSARAIPTSRDIFSAARKSSRGTTFPPTS